jgi:hypothetical protein
MSVNFFLRSLLVAVLITATASAVNLRWFGGTDSDFTNAANWYMGTSGTTIATSAPATGDIIDISSGASTWPVLATTAAGGGYITNVNTNGGAQLTFNSGGVLNVTNFPINALTSSSTGGTLTINAGATVTAANSSSHYWNAGTATIRGTISVNRSLYIASGGAAAYPRVMTINIFDGGTLSCGNQNLMQLGGGNVNNQGIINIWGANSSGTGSLLSFGNGTPAIPRSGSTNSYISLKDGGRIEYNTGMDSTFQTAINNNYIRSGDVRQLLTKAYVPGSTTRYRITTFVNKVAYNPSPASASTNLNSMTLVTLGTVPVTWTAPLETLADYRAEQRFYSNFSTGVLPVDVNGWPTDPNGDNLTLTQTFARAASTTPVSMSLPSMTSAVGGVYQWRVDSVVDYNATTGQPIISKGPVWYFRTGNSAPVSNAGAAATINQASGSSNWTSNATITDDGLPIGAAVTGTWTQLSGPATVISGSIGVTKASPNITLSLTTPGRYQFQLVASDTSLTGAASVVSVTVYTDTCAAAKAGGFTALTGDFNLDCKVTFIDFATFASNWGACNNQLGSCN